MDVHLAHSLQRPPALHPPRLSRPEVDLDQRPEYRQAHCEGAAEHEEGQHEAVADIVGRGGPVVTPGVTDEDE